MAYDVSALGSYTQPNEKTMLVKTVLAPKTISLLKSKGNVMTGVKTKSQLPSMDTDAVFQDGKGCGFNASGTTKISTRDVEVGAVKVQEALCPSDLEESFEQMNLTKGSDYTEVIFAADYSDLKAKKIAKALEVALWKGDKQSANVQLKRFDGFIKVIDGATGVIDGNKGAVTEAVGITQANVISILKDVRRKLPAEIRVSDAASIFVGQEVLDLYLDALEEKNLFHYKPDDQSTDEVYLHGTRTKIYGTPGLNDTNRIFAMDLNNMYFATDMMDETEKFELKYAPEAEEVRFSAKFKAGVQIAFPDEVVSFKLKAA